MAPSLTIAVLCYGNHPELAKRCLDSIKRALPVSGFVLKDVRIALSEVCAETRDAADSWCRDLSDRGISVLQYLPQGNPGKYPLMRKMLLEDASTPGDWVMWFDDDSYLTDGSAKWWNRLSVASRQADMLGQLWEWPVRGNQLSWMRTRPWFNPAVPVRLSKHPRIRGKPAFQFCQGAWWLLRRSVLVDFDWPDRHIRHNGGDSMLGEVLRQHGRKIQAFSEGVRINADAAGTHSKSKRRGMSLTPVGADYVGQSYDLSFHEFNMERIEWQAQKKSK